MCKASSPPPPAPLPEFKPRAQERMPQRIRTGQAGQQMQRTSQRKTVLNPAGMGRQSTAQMQDRQDGGFFSSVAAATAKLNRGGSRGTVLGA